MKINKEHYNHIKNSISAVIEKYGIDDIMNYKSKLVSGEIECKDVNTRLMYDLQRKAGLTRFVCFVLYEYANDDNYKVALFKVGKELNLIDTPWRKK